MNKKKKIVELENRVEVLEKQKESLETRIAVVDFKEEAKGAKFVIKCKHISGCTIYPFSLPHDEARISYLSERGDKVITKTFTDLKETVTQHDKYLEFWRDGKITSAMRVLRDELVEMDIDVYTKAFADWIAEQSKAYININANVNSVSEAIAKAAATAAQAAQAFEFRRRLFERW